MILLLIIEVHFAYTTSVLLLNLLNAGPLLVTEYF